MRISDTKVDPGAGIAEEHLIVPLTVTQSKTNRPIFAHRPRHMFRLTGFDVQGVAYTATLGYDLAIMGDDELIDTVGLAIDAVPEKIQVGAHRLRLGGVFYEKAAATAIAFTAAHQVAASKFGIILVQETVAGVVSTKVPAANQTYASAALALAALPAPDANNLAIGYIEIAADAGGWTAQTDDLTDGSDLTTAAFTSLAVTWHSALTATVAPVALKRVAGTLSSTDEYLQTRALNQDIVILATSDGSAVLTGGMAHVAYRPFPMHSEA